MQFRDLDGQKVAVLGCGREGRAAIAALLEYCPQLSFTVVDDNPEVLQSFDPHERIDCHFGTMAVEEWLAFDVLIKSPGISLYRQDLKAACRNGLRMTSLSSLWLAETNQAITIGVTGTKGKSTTASMLRDLLVSTGKRVALRGNVGRPLFDPDEGEFDADFVIIEFSSFQLADLEGSLDYALITNLSPEHLDWHGNAEQYFADKLRVVSLSRRVLASQDCPELSYRLRGQSHVDWFGHDSPFKVTSAGVEYQGDLLIGKDQMVAPGRHNLMNACGALALAVSLGVKAADAAPALKFFRPLSHRLETVAKKNGRLFVNDSLASTPLSTMAAIASFPDRSIHLIVGGADRGVDPCDLANELANLGHASGVQFVGAFGKRLFEYCCERGRANKMSCAMGQAANLEEAVKASWLHSKSGDVILLSPGAPSFDCFRDYAHRGEAFRLAVAGLKPSDEGNEAGIGNFDY